MSGVRPAGIDELPVWQRVRRYAVPAEMIEMCTAARMAGDWRAACAAGRIDVPFDLAELRREHGRRQAERIAADLAVLAPDLLRWHLPRALGGRTSLVTHRQWTLSTDEGRFGADDLVLVLEAPKTVDGSQRMRLTVRPALADRSDRQDLPPAFWSAAHVTGLAEAYGGSAARLPGFEADGRVRPFEAYATAVDPADPASRVEVFDRHLADGDVAGAWAAFGVDIDLVRPEGRHYEEAVDAFLNGTVVPFRLTTELSRLHGRYGLRRVAISTRWRRIGAVHRRDDGGLSAELLSYHRENFQQPQLASVVHARSVDLELIRHGLLGRAELHPQVRQALFPAVPAGGDPGVPTGIAAGGPRSDPPLRVPVRCQGQWHQLVHTAGRLDLVSHTAEELAREQLLSTLGGPVVGCVAALRAWRGSGGRVPRPLRKLRRDVLQRVQHGGAAALTELLDAGLDPLMCDGRGRTLLHHMRAVEDPALVRRLVDAGVPVDAADRRGRTALHVAVGDGGTPEIVGALLAAGADPQAADNDRTTVVELADGKAMMHYFEGEGDPDHPQVRIRGLVVDWAQR